MLEIKKNYVSAILEGIPYSTYITAGNHKLIADEPVADGGTDKGPKPHDILLSALASCTCITVKMYAQRKGWKLESVASECILERYVEDGMQISKISQHMTFKGELDEEMVSRLLVIANKCPVHKTLSPAIKIETTLKKL